MERAHRVEDVAALLKCSSFATDGAPMIANIARSTEFLGANRCPIGG
jgi:hypothetical protein